MLTNAQMVKNRYERWARARKLIGHITANLKIGRTVYLCTYTKATKYTTKHISMFKANRNGAWVQRGKSWDCIDGVVVRVYE